MRDDLTLFDCPLPREFGRLIQPGHRGNGGAVEPGGEEGIQVPAANILGSGNEIRSGHVAPGVALVVLSHDLPEELIAQFLAQGIQGERAAHVDAIVEEVIRGGEAGRGDGVGIGIGIAQAVQPELGIGLQGEFAVFFGPEGVSKGGKGLVEPDIAPGTDAKVVAKPTVGQFVGDHVAAVGILEVLGAEGGHRLRFQGPAEGAIHQDAAVSFEGVGAKSIDEELEHARLVLDQSVAGHAVALGAIVKDREAGGGILAQLDVILHDDEGAEVAGHGGAHGVGVAQAAILQGFHGIRPAVADGQVGRWDGETETVGGFIAGVGIDGVPEPCDAGLAVGVDGLAGVLPGAGEVGELGLGGGGAALVLDAEGERGTGRQGVDGGDDELVLEVLGEGGRAAVHLDIIDLQAGEIDVEAAQVLGCGGLDAGLADDLVCGDVDFELEIVVLDVVAAVAEVGKEGVAQAGGADVSLGG